MPWWMISPARPGPSQDSVGPSGVEDGEPRQGLDWDFGIPLSPGTIAIRT